MSAYNSISILLVTLFMSHYSLWANSGSSVPLDIDEDLLSDMSHWESISPYPVEQMTFTRISLDSGSHHLVTVTGETSDEVGGWIRSLPNLEEGRAYRFEVCFQYHGPEGPDGKVVAMIFAGSDEFRLLKPEKIEGNLWVLGTEFICPQNFSRGRDAMNIRLMTANARNSRIIWERARLQRFADNPVPRIARLAAISGRAPNPLTPDEAIDFYCERLDSVGKIGGVDLVCLPENINVDLVPGNRWKHLDTIPGMTTSRLGEKARQYGMYIVAGIAEIDNGVRFNTAVLINRQGEIVGKYRKNHLTLAERYLMGIRQGSSYPVFDTDFGRVGLLICYDNHWGETARILSLKGAEILVMPNAADGRETHDSNGRESSDSWNSRWEPYMQTRAMDNHIHFVSAVNFGGSIIVSPNGSTLVINDHYLREPGGIVYADCDLNDSVETWIRMSIDKEYLQLRRDDIYDELNFPYTTFVRDNDTPEKRAEYRAEEINSEIDSAEEKCADDPLPRSENEIRVSNDSELQAALEAAISGTHIVLEEGTVFEKPVELRRSFDSRQPLVIRAEGLLQSIIRAPWKISGEGHIIKGLKWEGYGNVLAVTASHVRVTRCAFLDSGNPDKGPREVILLSNPTGVEVRNIRIDRCEIGRYTEDGISIIHNGSISDLTIDHNHIHSHYGSGLPYRNGIGIYVGANHNFRERDLRALVAFNYLHDLDSAHPIHIKSSGNFILFNRIDANPLSGIGNLNVRSGRDNLLAGNTLTGGAILNLRDYYSIALGNSAQWIRVTSGSMEFNYDFMPATWINSEGETYNPHPSSRNALLCGNRGEILLGFEYENNLNAPDRLRVPAQNTVIYEHRGSVTLVRTEDGFNAAGTWSDRSGLPSPHFLHVPLPVDLEESQVGPLSAPP